MPPGECCRGLPWAAVVAVVVAVVATGWQSPAALNQKAACASHFFASFIGVLRRPA